MQPYLLSPEDRIRHWKEYRLSLDDTMNDMEQLLNTMHYWNQYPIINRYIDPYSPETWPTSWEMIYANEYCKSSLAFLMEQTLLLGFDNRWTVDRLKMFYIDDTALSDAFIVLVIDNKHVLNYDQDQIINLDSIVKTCIIRHEYLLEDSKHIII